ncbi:hypothetical protein EDD85DRAFT_433884 [Armillaria nabsnona]|nr:hypothetical protein EDD85DRAFT_433884 [Armillaria nabsnona]
MLPHGDKWTSPALTPLLSVIPNGFDEANSLYSGRFSFPFIQFYISLPVCRIIHDGGFIACDTNSLSVLHCASISCPLMTVFLTNCAVVAILFLYILIYKSSVCIITVRLEMYDTDGCVIRCRVFVLFTTARWRACDAAGFYAVYRATDNAFLSAFCRLHIIDSIDSSHFKISRSNA